MSRYTYDLKLDKPADFVEFMMNDYLDKNGFSVSEWKKQQVYRAGDAMLEGYKYMTWNYRNGVLHVEAWLMGTFGREMGLKGFVGCLQKKPFKKSLENLYTLLQQDVSKEQMSAAGAGQAADGSIRVTTVNNTTAASVSLALGIIGCIGALVIPIVGLLFGVLAVMQGRLGMGSTKAGLAKAGKILGIIACVAAVVIWVLNIFLSVL